MSGILQQLISRIPGQDAYEEQASLNSQRTAQGMANTTAQMGILAQMAAQQQKQKALEREGQFRAEIAGATTPEAQLAVAIKYGGPDAVAKTAASHMDRQATIEAARVNSEAQREQRKFEIEQKGKDKLEQIEAAARENRITRADADARALQTRREMAMLMATLRPAPQPRNLQLTADEGGNQLVVNADGTTTPLVRDDGTGVKKAVGADKPMTEFQGKAALYGTRAAQSDKVLKALEDTISTAGLSAKQSASKTPLIGGALGAIGNAMLSTEAQRVEQAQRDFVNAVLRQESGASISESEFANAQKQYFPATGDDQATKDQKRANRELAIAGFSRMSGPKGAVDIDAIRKDPLLPGVKGTNKAAGAIAPATTNARGWGLMTDANGNKAYVSPDGKQFEEVK